MRKNDTHPARTHTEPIDALFAPTSERGERVADAMLVRPKTLPASASVADLRRLFANPKVRTALLVDGAALAGVVDQDDLPAAAADDERARDYARSDVMRVAPDTALRSARAWLDDHDERRLVVVEADGTLRGLLCLNRRRTGFCRDRPDSPVG